MINKAITKLALFMALGIGLVNPNYAKANNNLAQCFDNNINYKSLAHYEAKESNYYLVDIISTPTNSQRNVVKVEPNGNCSIVVKEEQLLFYPLTNFLGKEIAHNLLTSRYLTLIEEHGSPEALSEALLDELEADSPNIFFEEDIEILEKLGVDLKLDIAPIVVVGEEGVPGHPELQHLK